ncbi:MAG: cache domain-containing protein, partial [Pseudomonadota bacterium]
MRSVRLRLLTLALLPLVVLLPILLGVTMWRWIDKFDDLLIAKVASDLRIAEQYFGTIEATQAVEIAALAQSVEFADAKAQGDAALRTLLSRVQDERGFDFLVYQSIENGPLPRVVRDVAAAAAPDTPSAGLAVLDAEALNLLGDDLAERAAIALVPTEAARPIDRDVETRGMVILVANQEPGSDAVLIGGRLLNRNLDIIDTMNTLIYRERAEIDARTGTTTLFLDDVRISTNVRLFEGSRALGTRVSEVVFQQVMQDGVPWLDRAFVVNDWYVSGYVPLS